MKNSIYQTNTETYIKRGHHERSKAFWSMMDRLSQMRKRPIKQDH
ncbi:MAG: hypothetical protein ABJK39_05360 [Hyphomicrobiales bacterium]